MKNFLQSTAVIGVSVSLALLPAATASSDPGGEPLFAEETGPDRVIYLDEPAPDYSEQQHMEDVAGTETVTQVTSGADFPVEPEPGTTVRIVYTNAVTDVTTEPVLHEGNPNDGSSATPAAACTHSRTAYEPFKPDVYQAYQVGRFSVSSGCDPYDFGTGYTIRQYTNGWGVSSQSGSLSAGSTITRTTSSRCETTASSEWFGIATMKGTTNGPTVRLTCTA